MGNNTDNQINSWACFSVISYGGYDDNGRYISKETDAFDPDEITHLLNTPPKYTRRYGEHRSNSNDTNSIYKSSKWSSNEITDPPVNRNDLCYCIIQWLMPYEEELISFKKKHNVFYEIEICIYVSGNDILINSDIVSFCDRVGIEIRFNTLLTEYANSDIS